ncbi:hypothetical protein EV643_101162 [Kribbella sp. VKM Ac-2527]|uniref:Uncharacterized protein n=1 Tax=Kribbella caucasensis TaxID=2512215 RepID=A0A4R6KPX0_9ACTN|nr:hypothetical protein EV643_101162 [Kribbella sp. VKM Ac-2527]
MGGMGVVREVDVGLEVGEDNRRNRMAGVPVGPGGETTGNTTGNKRCGKCIDFGCGGR